MSDALAHRAQWWTPVLRSPRRRIKIFRPDTRGGRAAFQREWEPVFSPDMRPDPAPRMLTISLPLIPQRFHSAVVGTALTVALTAVVSLGITIKTVGLAPDALFRWLAAWQVACLIAVPARFALLPLVSRVVGLVVEPPAARH